MFAEIIGVPELERANERLWQKVAELRGELALARAALAERDDTIRALRSQLDHVRGSLPEVVRCARTLERDQARYMGLMRNSFGTDKSTLAHDAYAAQSNLESLLSSLAAADAPPLAQAAPMEAAECARMACGQSDQEQG